MADMKDGFSVSFKAGADMLTVQGIDYATFKKNLEELFGDEDAPSALGRFISADSVALGNVQAILGPVTPATTSPAPVPNSEGGQLDTPVDAPVEERTFDVCGAPTANGPCGSLKNEWKPGGKRANGTTYQGFWGCPDWKQHLKGKR